MKQLQVRGNQLPSTRTLEAGNAVIRLSLDDRVSQGLKQFEAKLKTVGASIQRVGSIGLGIASAVGAPFLAAINHAKNAQESLSRFSAVFKEQSAAATAFADTLAKQVGRSAIEIKDGLSSFQSFFLGLGFTADRSRELSQSLQALSIDFASFNNLTDEDAMGRFISAMSGSSEVVDRYGINLKQAAMQEELLAEGVKKTWTEVTEQEKAIARLNIIMKSMGAQGAVGDAERTAGSLSNQLKALNAQIKDAAVEIGTALIPASTQLVTQATDAARSFSKWASENMALITSTATATVKLAAFSVVVTGVGTVVRATATAVAGLRVAMVALGSHPVIAGITAAVAGMMALDKWVDKTYRTSERLGKKLSELGPPRKLTPEEEAAGPYMLDRFGNAILDQKVSDMYGDAKAEDKPKSPYSNGQSFGGEKGVFSNGRTIGGSNDPWDNPRPVPFANTPSIDRTQDGLARLGLNRHEMKGPGGTLLQDVFNSAADALKETMKDVAAAVDSAMEFERQRLDPSIAAAGAVASSSQSGKAIATLDASFAAQQFSGRGREVELLTSIDKNTKRTADQRFGLKGVRG